MNEDLDSTAAYTGARGEGGLCRQGEWGCNAAGAIVLTALLAWLAVYIARRVLQKGWRRGLTTPSGQRASLQLKQELARVVREARSAPIATSDLAAVLSALAAEQIDESAAIAAVRALIASPPPPAR